MSDSSEDEDLSKFQEAVVDSSSFIAKPENSKKKTERYLEESTHYNDVKIPVEMQKRIGAQVSYLLMKNITFVDIPHKEKKRKIKGGVKLFNTSTDYLTCEFEKDLYTEEHNKKSKKIKNNKRKMYDNECDINDKIKEVTVDGDFVLSGEETKFYKSRRKEKLYKYKAKKDSNVMVSVE